MDDWIASKRKIRNVSIEAVYSGKSDWNNEELRNKFVIRKNMPTENQKRLEWTFRTPKRIREYAIRDLLAERKACETQIKKKNIRRYKFQPISRYKTHQSIVIPHEGTYIRDSYLCISGMQIRLCEVSDVPVNHNMRLTRRNGKYFLHIPNFNSLKIDIASH